jgi:TolB protein
MVKKNFALLSVLNLLVISALVLAACSKTSPTAVPKQATQAPTTALPTLALHMAPPTSAPAANTYTIDSVVKGQIVFYAWVGGHNQIFIERADGSDVRQLVKSEFDDLSPALSPDGRKVVFTRWTPEPTGIYVVNVDGTDLHQLNAAGCVKPCVNLEVEGHPWSPDGTQIVYDRAVADASGQCCVEVGWWVMNADGSGAHPVWYLTPATEDHNVDWSPDGKRFVFMRRDNTMSPVHTAIFTRATDGSDVQQLTSWELDANDPAWSPDGKLIAFCTICDYGVGDLNIYSIHPNGTGLTQLTSNLNADGSGSMATFHPSWSPNGKQIVFSHYPSTNGTSDLFVMNRDGSDLHVLALTDIFEANADWGISPKPKLKY